jgi:uncharacterized protein (DUF305 family)
MKHSIITSLAAAALLAALTSVGPTWADDHEPAGMQGEHGMHGEMHEHMQKMHEHMHDQMDQKNEKDQKEDKDAHSQKDGGAHDHSGAEKEKSDAPKSDATRAYEDANAKMHRDMGAALTGDADVDFMQGMIPHHQGAIDMAEIALKYGKDPEVRKLAEEVIKAQTAEIVFMKEGLAKHGK